MADGWYPSAVRDVAASSAGAHLGPVTVGVLHTTESSRGSYRPGGPKNYGNFGHTSFPHFTVDVQNGKFKVWQHISLHRAAKALRNRTGGVETNREGVIQIEVVGRASQPFTSNAILVAGLGRLMRWIEENTDIPRAAPAEFHPYPPDRGAQLGREPWRLSGTEWVQYRGWLGHQHVPENSHGDPGAIDIGRLLLVGVTHPPSVQEDEKMYAIVSDPRTGGDYGTDGTHKFPFASQLAKNDWAKAFKAVRITLSADAFDAIPTVTR